MTFLVEKIRKPQNKKSLALSVYNPFSDRVGPPLPSIPSAFLSGYLLWQSQALP